MSWPVFTVRLWKRKGYFLVWRRLATSFSSVYDILPFAILYNRICVAYGTTSRFKLYKRHLSNRELGYVQRKLRQICIIILLLLTPTILIESQYKYLLLWTNTTIAFIDWIGFWILFQFWLLCTNYFFMLTSLVKYNLWNRFSNRSSTWFKRNQIWNGEYTAIIITFINCVGIFNLYFD